MVTREGYESPRPIPPRLRPDLTTFPPPSRRNGEGTTALVSGDGGGGRRPWGQERALRNGPLGSGPLWGKSQRVEEGRGPSS